MNLAYRVWRSTSELYDAMIFVSELKNGYTVNVISDCVTGYDLTLLLKMCEYYMSKGCNMLTLEECI